MNKPTDSVRIVIFDVSDPAQFLVLAEADDPTNWKLPGGKFDSVDETPVAAATRELREELGLEATAVQLRQVGELKNDDGVSARYIFAATADKAAPNPSAEIEAVQWVTPETIPDSPNKAHIESAVSHARNANPAV
ncbi:MAG TPA: NUDIX hydrolase [Candidatus Saccharimonadales bacterium]|nr:NUDIX hydrolase [Candidatus Saccharimonadales bacterium]